MSPDPLLSPEHHHVISLLADGSTLSAAAQTAGIHRNTIGHWRRTNPAFAQALAAARYDRALHFRDLAEEHAALAISTIRDLLADPQTPPSVRLKAALAILKECTTPPPPEPALTDSGLLSNLDALLAPAPAVVQNAVVQNDRTQNLHNSAQPAPASAPGRNAPCLCGSGRKFKQCCLNTPAKARAA